MTKPELDTLIQDALEGDASPERLSRLREALARDEAVRARHRELDSLFRLLREVSLEDPPADLRERAMEAVRASHGVGRARRGPAAGFRNPWRLAVPLAAAAAGLAIAIAFFAWPRVGGLVDGRDVGGAMAPRASGVPIYSDELRSGRVRASVQARRQDGRIRVQVEAADAAEAEVWIAFDPAELRVVGPVRAGPVGLAPAGPGRLKAAPAGGRIDATVIFEVLAPARTPIRVVLAATSGSAAAEIEPDAAPEPE